MGEEIIYKCSAIGVAGNTPVYLRKRDGKVEVRQGVSIMGIDNGVQGNPFDPDYFDNYATGIGDTEEQALQDLQANKKAISDSLWAF